MSMEAKRGLAIIASLALMAEPVVIGRVMLSSAALVLGMAAAAADGHDGRDRRGAAMRRGRASPIPVGGRAGAADRSTMSITTGITTRSIMSM